MTLDEAIARLEEAGFVVEKLGGAEQRILGGTSRSDSDGEYVYRGAFSILRSEAGWDLVVSGPEQAGERSSAGTLERIVELAVQRLLG